MFDFFDASLRQLKFCANLRALSVLLHVSYGSAVTSSSRELHISNVC